jgi:hypothetical protein
LQLHGRVAKQGDPVPEADKWDYSVVKAHVDLGMIEKAPESQASQIETSKEEAKKDNKKKRR